MTVSVKKGNSEVAIVSVIVSIEDFPRGAWVEAVE